jgi:hypothetical protein
MLHRNLITDRTLMLNMRLQLLIVIHVMMMGQCQKLWLQFTYKMVKSLKIRQWN